MKRKEGASGQWQSFLTVVVATSLLVILATLAPALAAAEGKGSPLKEPRIAILLYEGADELDIFGPMEVFGFTNFLTKTGSIYTVAESTEPVRLFTGTRVIPDYGIADAPLPDILIVPGAYDTSAATSNPKLVKYMNDVAESCDWLVGVCGGSGVLVSAGPAKGKRITSHHSAIEKLRQVNGADKVLEGVRYVRDGKLVTSAGVSAGIDMSLWLVGQLHGPGMARKVQRILEYYPAPPYAGDV